MNLPRRRFALGVLTILLCASLPHASAQQPTAPGASPSGAEPQRAVSATGIVQRFTQSATGAVDGFVLDNGIMVHFPAYLGSKVTALIAPNAQVRVTGLMADPAGPTSATRLLEASTITDLRSNRTMTLTGSAGTQPGATVSGDDGAGAAGAAGAAGGGAAGGGAAGGGAAGGTR